jgi:hypothetical protein
MTSSWTSKLLAEAVLAPVKIRCYLPQFKNGGEQGLLLVF